jgi:hypothetical protein
LVENGRQFSRLQGNQARPVVANSAQKPTAACTGRFQLLMQRTLLGSSTTNPSNFGV